MRAFKPTHLFPSAFMLWLLASSPSLGAGQATAGSEADGQGPSWPVEVTLGDYLVVIYQPQPESFEGNLLEGRFVLSAEETAEGAEPVFGTAWFEARVDTDRDERMVTIRNMEVVRVHFPDIEPEQATRAAATLTDWLAGQELDTSMDEFLTTIDLAERRDLAVAGLSMAPPEILYRNTPAVLVMIDGDPILERIQDSDLMAVVNTAFAILFDTRQSSYYLFAGDDLWYQSTAATGPWQFTQTVPATVRNIIPPPDDQARAQMQVAPESLPDEPGSPPEILVSTVPSEIIATVGEAQFTPISETELMFVGNTDSDLLFHTPSQDFYVLLSGRWFRSKELGGPWVWVASEDLPETFQSIPADSQMGSIRAHVAGTDEAEEAVLDAQIPQTAAIRRDDKSLEVQYDGDPQWEDIPETSLQYAPNTQTPVIAADQRYYAVSDGVWYVAANATGPWMVATAVPEEIYRIPPSSPVYHVTYVEIYQTTPEYVYVGYTPGYTGTYVHHTTVVYGTGWYYRPWWGSYYYPRYSTWGWHMRWNPWTGWNMGPTWTNGWFTFGIGYSPWRPWCCYGGWWGPRPIHPIYYANRRAAYHAGYRSGFYAGYRAGQANLYNSARVANRRATPAQLDRNRPTAPAARPQARPSTRPNNVLADRDGNILRNTDRGWEQKSPGGNWGPPAQNRPTAPAARPSQPQARPSQPPVRPTQPQTRPSQPQARPGQPQARPTQPQARPQTRQQELNRSQQQRSRGTARSQQFQQSRSVRPPTTSRPPVRRRGGENEPPNQGPWLLAGTLVLPWRPHRR